MMAILLFSRNFLQNYYKYCKYANKRAIFVPFSRIFARVTAIRLPLADVPASPPPVSLLCLLRPNRIWTRLCRPLSPALPSFSSISGRCHRPPFVHPPLCRPSSIARFARFSPFFSFFPLQNLHIPIICCTFAPGLHAVSLR